MNFRYVTSEEPEDDDVFGADTLADVVLYLGGEVDAATQVNWLTVRGHTGDVYVWADDGGALRFTVHRAIAEGMLRGDDDATQDA